jgi:hypothetical protein
MVTSEFDNVLMRDGYSKFAQAGWLLLSAFIGLFTLLVLTLLCNDPKKKV